MRPDADGADDFGQAPPAAVYGDAENKHDRASVDDSGVAVDDDDGASARGHGVDDVTLRVDDDGDTNVGIDRRHPRIIASEGGIHVVVTGASARSRRVVVEVESGVVVTRIVEAKIGDDDAVNVIRSTLPRGVAKPGGRGEHRLFGHVVQEGLPASGIEGVSVNPHERPLREIVSVVGDGVTGLDGPNHQTTTETTGEDIGLRPRLRRHRRVPVVCPHITPMTSPRGPPAWP